MGANASQYQIPDAFAHCEQEYSSRKHEYMPDVRSALVHTGILQDDQQKWVPSRANQGHAAAAGSRSRSGPAPPNSSRASAGPGGHRVHAEPFSPHGGFSDRPPPRPNPPPGAEERASHFKHEANLAPNSAQDYYRNGEVPGNNYSSREGYVMNTFEDGDRKAPATFSPWAPEGVFKGDRDAAGGSSGSRRRNSKTRVESPSARRQDTRIGAGISDFLKRGVAQAGPKQQETNLAEMMESADGGFMATMQQGFSGIFGMKPTTKEEVLKQKGPVPASEYEAVPADDIDQRVQFYARQIPVHLGECLKIYRISKGEYKVGNEVVHMNWQQAPFGTPDYGQQGPDPRMRPPQREVFVSVKSSPEQAEVEPEPLPFYLRHCANAAYDLQFGSAIAKVPESSRLSFAEERGTLLKDSDAESKYNAMVLAAEQAKKRQQAAMEWRNRKDAECNSPDSPRSPRSPGGWGSPPGQKAQARKPESHAVLPEGEPAAASGGFGNARKPSHRQTSTAAKDVVEAREPSYEGILPELPPLLQDLSNFPLNLFGTATAPTQPPGYVNQGYGGVRQQVHPTAHAPPQPGLYAGSASYSVSNTTAASQAGSFYGAGLQPSNGTFVSSVAGGSFYGAGIQPSAGTFAAQPSGGSFYGSGIQPAISVAALPSPSGGSFYGAGLIAPSGGSFYGAGINGVSQSTQPQPHSASHVMVGYGHPLPMALSPVR
eukprot:TRINITY_DN9748_c0_g1_i1.p1 TRINITY_DN9748_c0_g1~~TRINITY_DN9748_c0_g1_i1.p1  ORF type:complete len:713 (+),score=136.79 TRINITY_DN9748_c0_g1_i1:109-2247(+)